jgi:hypothetical protein
MRVSQLNASATVNVQNAPSGAKLSAWIDFNGDGNFGGPGEQIADSKSVANGTNMVTFDVPSTAKAGATFARFRLSTAGGLGVKGAATDGEVEDYKVTIMGLNQGLGTFGPQGPVSSTVSSAWGVAPGDVDGDGDMDIVAFGASGVAGTTTVYWCENDGSQSFTQHAVAAPGVARSAVAADLDGDGDMDLAVGGDFGIAWYENNGSQTFTSHSVSAQFTFTLTAADVDGDGDLDLVGSGGSRVAWYENNGSQTFTQNFLPGSVTSASGLAVADIDRDGDLDIAYTGLADNVIGWYQNNGSQTFTSTNIDSSAMGARNVVLVDLDHDGDMDFAAVSSNDDSVQWYENNGTQTFTKRTI